jgi:hypothetical protein
VRGLTLLRVNHGVGVGHTSSIDCGNRSGNAAKNFSACFISKINPDFPLKISLHLFSTVFRKNYEINSEKILNPFGGRRET